ncbi:ankyrin repeat-containing domain protein [Mycena latifolia]|nr:ankyrin repeat-containing domain protein [Mycena latifolia]
MLILPSALMAEALGTLASILQLVDTILKAREYFKDFHEAPKEQKKLFSEMEGLQALLVELDKRVTGNSSSAAFQEMMGPLAALNSTMEHVTEKLGLIDGLSKVPKRLGWTLWGKNEVAGYLQELEHIKALINLWLTMDIWDVGQKQISNQDSILNMVQEQRDIINAERRQKILDWMSPLNFLQRQADVFGALQSGTGEWLLSNTVFQDWKSGSGKVVFCRGIPGAGKTVLVSLVVNHLEAQALNSGSGLACIYLNHKETQTQTVPNLLGALVTQLMLGKHIPPLVHSLYEHHLARRTRPNIDEFRKALDLVVALYPKVYLVIDALDEYPENYRHLFLKYLGTLDPKVNIMMTSRPHINLDPQFPNMRTIEIHATEEDIHKYLDTQIQKSVRLSKHIHTRPELCNEIQAKIGENAKGMFLLAKLHIESLITKNTIKAVREALQCLPNNLQHTYDQAMERIKHQTEEDRQLGLLALTWVANAKRPLFVAELREALAIEPESSFLDTDNLLDMDIILSVCAGLIIVDEAVSVDYLDSIQSEQFPLAHITIVSTCLTYLSFPQFEVLPEDWIQQREMLVTYPFLQYAQYCLTHVKGVPEDSLQDKLMAFLTGASQFTRVWNDTVPWKEMYSDDHLCPLSISAACGLEITMRQLLAQGIAPEDMDTALCAASSNGHIHLVQLLIDKGAKINFQDVHYGHPLATASEEGHQSVVQLLIENDADVNAQGGDYGNALQAASMNGHKSVVQLLIDKGANVNAQGGNYGNALQAASQNGHESVVQLLIEKDANVNAHGDHFGNALQAASFYGHMSVVQLLIVKGAEVNAQGDHFGNPLQVASASSHKSVVQFLIEKGADVNAQGGPYGNALQAASQNGHELVAQLLIEKGADVNAQGGDYGNALQAASLNGHDSVVQLLIEKGADVNAQGGIYGNALQAALEHGHKSVVQILLEKGADLNEQEGYFGDALQAASVYGHESMVQLLIEKGADVNAQGGYFGNALQAVSSNGNKSMVQLLIKKGADVNAQGGNYGNALQAASVNGHESVVQLLIEKGADVNAQGGHYGNSLQAASENGHESVVQLLIKMGVDVNAQGGFYGNALQAASAYGYESVVQLLIKKGADVNAQGGYYGNALQAASRPGHKSVIQLLIEKGAEVNAQGGFYGNTLQAASRTGHKEGTAEMPFR